jgi:hypothetical protein
LSPAQATVLAVWKRAAKTPSKAAIVVFMTHNLEMTSSQQKTMARLRFIVALAKMQ